jgi:hypothetical protein
VKNDGRKGGRREEGGMIEKSERERARARGEEKKARERFY